MIEFYLNQWKNNKIFIELYDVSVNVVEYVTIDEIYSRTF